MVQITIRMYFLEVYYSRYSGNKKITTQVDESEIEKG